MPVRWPEVEERKRKLDGRTLRYRCEALELSPQRAVLLYRTTHDVDLAGVGIPAGTLSYGVYWAERPFNVYRWVDGSGTVIAHYFNVATDTRLSAEAVDWLDLEVDVLFTPDGHVRVLDEEEVPADLAPAHRAALATALARLSDPSGVVAEVEHLLESLAT